MATTVQTQRTTPGRRKHQTRKGRESFRKRNPRLAREIEARDGHACVYCAATKLTSGRALQFDHVHPRSEGGEDRADNVVLACASCNSARKAMTLRQWCAYSAEIRGNVFTVAEIRARLAC